MSVKIGPNMAKRLINFTTFAYFGSRFLEGQADPSWDELACPKNGLNPPYVAQQFLL